MPWKRVSHVLMAALAGAAAAATELSPETNAAFDRYIRSAETRIQAEDRSDSGFLWAGRSGERLSRVRKGDIVVEPFDDKELIEVPSGLIHDWIGAAFISGATLDQTLGLVQQYDRHRDYYQPEVVDSKLVSRNGDQFHIFLRLLKKKVLTVILNTEHDVRYTRLDARRAYSISRSTKIAEVEDAGKPQERELPAGSGHGFLWRLNSYWRFQERDGGVYVECEAISLTRDVPTGLGWMIGPIVKSLPRESLENTLRATRQAVKAQRATAPRAESGK